MLKVPYPIDFLLYHRYVMAAVSDLWDDELYHVGTVISYNFVRRLISIERGRETFILY